MCGLAVAPTGFHGEGVGVDALVFHADVQGVVGVVENDAVVGVVDKQCPCFEIVIGSGEHRELVDSQVLLRQLIVLVRDANDAVSLADVVGTQHQILPVRGDGGLADEAELILQTLRALVVEVLARVQRVAVRLRLLGGKPEAGELVQVVHRGVVLRDVVALLLAARVAGEQLGVLVALLGGDAVVVEAEDMAELMKNRPLELLFSGQASTLSDEETLALQTQPRRKFSRSNRVADHADMPHSVTLAEQVVVPALHRVHARPAILVEGVLRVRQLLLVLTTATIRHRDARGVQRACVDVQVDAVVAEQRLQVLEHLASGAVEVLVQRRALFKREHALRRRVEPAAVRAAALLPLGRHPVQLQEHVRVLWVGAPLGQVDDGAVCKREALFFPDVGQAVAVGVGGVLLGGDIDTHAGFEAPGGVGPAHPTTTLGLSGSPDVAADFLARCGIEGLEVLVRSGGKRPFTEGDVDLVTGLHRREVEAVGTRVKRAGVIRLERLEQDGRIKLHPSALRRLHDGLHRGGASLDGEGAGNRGFAIPGHHGDHVRVALLHTGHSGVVLQRNALAVHPHIGEQACTQPTRCGVRVRVVQVREPARLDEHAVERAVSGILRDLVAAFVFLNCSIRWRYDERRDHRSTQQNCKCCLLQSHDPCPFC